MRSARILQLSTIVLSMLCLMAVAPSAHAQSIPYRSMSIDCGNNRVFIWIEDNGSATCQQSGTNYRCSSSADYVEADCSDPSPCQRVQIGDIAGCYSTTNAHLPNLNLMDPNETIKCSNGNVFDLKGQNGDTCDKVVTTHEDGTKSTTGGKCSHVENGAEVITTSTDCDSCGPSKMPADCTQR